jgi:heme/copper-type cytochrome/quinol oxidase subunit 2
MISIPHRTALASLFIGVLLLAGVSAWTLRPAAQGATREFTITGDQFAFKPVRIEVQKDDLVKITFTASDMAHSFVVDNPYRIAKRAGSGQTVVFEFRADQAGSFPFYCNLTQDERCRQMRGELVVK